MERTLPCSTTEACFEVLATLTAILSEYARSSVGINSTWTDSVDFSSCLGIHAKAPPWNQDAETLEVLADSRRVLGII